MNKQFQEWFYSISKYSDMIYSDGERGEYRTNIQYVWDSLPFSCQWGVYLEFFDSKGIQIEVLLGGVALHDEWMVIFNDSGKEECERSLTRLEAQRAAIVKANELCK